MSEGIKENRKKENLMESISRHYIVVLVLILLLAGALRMIGADWGMPYGNLHPDEGIIYDEAFECALNHNFDVHQYYRPNHVSIKCNTILYTLLQELYFNPRGMTDLETNYNEHLEIFLTASRILVALFGIGAVFFVYLIGLFWDRKVALLSAFFAAVFPSLIEHSHYITPDIPLLFFLLGVLWAALGYHKNPSVKWIIWMSLFTAFAACEKYPGLYGCVIVAVSVIVSNLKKPVRILLHGLLAIAFLFVGVMAISPVLILDYHTVLETIKGQNHEFHPGADGLSKPETFLFYAKTTAIAMGLLLSLSCLYGIYAAVREGIRSLKFRKDGPNAESTNAESTNAVNTYSLGNAIILLALFCYIFPISVLSIHWERYLPPVYVAGVIFGAIGIFTFVRDLKGWMERLPGNGFKWVPVAVSWILILLPALSLLCGSVAQVARFLAPDSRVYLQSEFADMEISPSNTTFDCNTPLDPGGFYGVFSNFEGADPARYMYGTPLYICTSSAQRDVYLNSNQELYGIIADFYRKLDENYPCIYCYTAETPAPHFLEPVNIFCNARSVYRYLKGTAAGYEIRLYLYKEL